MSAWVEGTSLGEDIGTLVADNARVPKVATNGSGALHAACSTTLNDAEMAYAELPSPDPDVTQWLDQRLRAGADVGQRLLRRRRPPTRRS